MTFKLVDDYNPELSDFVELITPHEKFIGIARIDDVYAGRARVEFVCRRSLTEYGYTNNILDAHNFYTVEEAQGFMDTRLRTAIARRNKLVTAFKIIEIRISIIRVF